MTLAPTCLAERGGIQMGSTAGVDGEREFGGGGPRARVAGDRGAALARGRLGQARRLASGGGDD
ncbi:hypothetical protein E2562_018769 [Oryza meyeriana var. granulata]|uniref:Uncharacterized protein n=1 Tax=Oryza meyeriana var. granulata TaxID=110450 RepID=A0A6G1EX50_9ORYZ|nr:hypothetical protein E2562_018769 [Oryza meyeriana var. granulata]